MLKSAQDIRILLVSFWPSIGFMWLADREYWLPDLVELKQAVTLARHQMQIKKFIDEVSDCDDFALQLHALIKLNRSLAAQTDSALRQLAFGEAFGRRFNAWEAHHTNNIAVTRDNSIYIIEPRDGDIWKAHPKDDDVLLVKM